MPIAIDRLHNRMIDEYLASCPSFCPPSDDGAQRSDVPKRYSTEDRERILSDIFDDNPHRDQACVNTMSSQRSLNLFGVADCDCDHPSAAARPSAFFDRVIQAYLAVHDGFSIDRLIADRDRNSLFISKCWTLGVRASARELNWSLLNARKANRIGPVQTVTRFSMPASDMYQFLYASEIALRHVQNNELVSNQRSVSLDLILCDPTMSDRFESVARQLAPGHSAFEYRWAAMCIRKNQRRSVKSRPPRFHDLGPTTQLRASTLPKTMGFYWFQSNNKSLYIGHAENVQAQVDRIIQHGGSKRVFPDWLYEGLSSPVRLGIAPTTLTALSKRETLKSEVCLTHSPLFNTLVLSNTPRHDGDPMCHTRCA